MRGRRRLARRLSVSQALTYSVFGVHMPFLPVWMADRGLSAGEIGFILAVPALLRVMFAAPLTALADHRISAPKLVALLQGAVMLAYVALALANGFWPVLVLTILFAIPNAAVVPLSDTLLMAHARVSGVVYGPVRVWGSVAFLVANVAGGALVALGGPVIVAPALAALSGLAALVSWATPAAERPADREEAELDGAGQAAGGARLLALVILAAAAIHASHAALYSFASLRWAALGHSEGMIGVLWAVGVGAEILLFALAPASLMKPANAVRWLMLGAATALLRFATIATGHDFGAIGEGLLQMLHAGSYGATHLATVALMSNLAPAGGRARMQGRLAAANAFGIAACTMIAGRLFAFAPSFAFAAMLVPAAAGLTLSFVAIRRLAR